MKTKRAHRLLVIAGFAAISVLAFALSRTGPKVGPSQNKESESPGKPNAVFDREQTQPQSSPAGSSLEIALAETEPARRRHLIQGWADSFSVNDIAGLLVRNELIKDKAIREELRDALLASWLRRDMAGLASWSGQGEKGDGQDLTLLMDARKALLDTLGKWTPERALDWMEASLPAQVKDALYEPYFLKLVTGNPAAACVKLSDFAQAESAANHERWGELFRRALGQWIAGDVSTAASWVEALPDGPVKTKALLVICYQWTETNPREATAWGAGLPLGGARDVVIAKLATLNARKDPATAAGYLDGISEGVAKDEARVAVAYLWTVKDPAMTSKWVSQFPEGAAREQALTQLVRTWAPAKPEEAAAWLQTLPDAPSTDLAVGTFSTTLLEDYPDMAFSAARSISNEPMRNAQLEQVVAAWAHADAAAARLFITQSPLPDELKQKLLVIAGPPSS